MIAWRPVEELNMDVLSGVRDNWFKLAASTLLVFAATCSGSAEDKLTGGPTPSPPGAAAHFLELKDGDTVPTKVTVRDLREPDPPIRVRAKCLGERP